MKVTKLDRIARSATQGIELIQSLIDKGITVHVLNMGMMDNAPTGKLVRNVMLAFAEFERDMIVERTGEGKVIARQNPDFKEGRPPKYGRAQLNHAMELLGNHSYKEVSEMTGIRVHCCGLRGSRNRQYRAKNLHIYFLNRSIGENPVKIFGRTNSFSFKKDAMNETLQKNVEAVLTGADEVLLSEIDSRLEELQKELLKVANSKCNYDAIADEIYRLREVRQNALVENAERKGMKKRISEMPQFLSEQTQEASEYDEQLVRRLIEKITVYDEWVTVEFKSGTSVKVRR